MNGRGIKAYNKLSTNDPYQYNIIIVENQWVELSIEKVSPTVAGIEIKPDNMVNCPPACHVYVISLANN